jgi:large subunit ribosomal protein L18
VAKPIGDFVLASAHSRELVKKYGWKGATGNVPVAYLTGLLCGLKAKKSGVTEAILDLGLVSPTKGSKVFSTMAGVVDAGVVIPHSDEKIVKERTRGDHIVEYAESLGEPAEFAPKFSVSIAKGLAPKDFGDHFNKVKTDIFAAFGVTWKPEPKVAKPVKKPEPKKVEAKPAQKAAEAKKPEAKVEVAAPKPAKVEVKAEHAEEIKPAAAKAKHAEAKVEAAPEAPKAEPKTKAVPKAKAEVKPEAKPAKAEKKPKAAEAKPKAAKKAKAEEAEEKPAKSAKPTKSAGRKE